MSNDIKALSISFRSDNGYIEHNNRDFFTDNVDKSRTPNNITYIKRDLRELYHELFDELWRSITQGKIVPTGKSPTTTNTSERAKKKNSFKR